VQDLHEHSHLLLFAKSDGKLLAVTRNFHVPVVVDALFPESKSRTHFWPSDTDRQWSVRLRRLGEDRLAIAMGAEKPGDKSTQVVILRRSVLTVLLPWLDRQFAGGELKESPRATQLP
jgi:hypothetical protein